MVKSRFYIYFGHVKFLVMFSVLLSLATTVLAQAITKGVVNTAGDDMVNDGLRLSWNIGTIGYTFFNEEYVLEGTSIDMGHRELALGNTDVDIYPNPFSTAITINVPIGMGDLSMSLIDINGQIVQRFALPVGLQTLQLDHLNPGVYIVRILENGSGYLKTSRIVKLN